MKNNNIDKDKLIKKLLDEIEEKERKLEAKDCLIRQQKNKILELESKLFNTEIDADIDKEIAEIKNDELKQQIKSRSEFYDFGIIIVVIAGIFSTIHHFI